MSKALNLVIVGVGGQGTLLASRVLGSIAGQLGLDVKLSEVHGMSQRGGSVTTCVRMGETVHSPLVEQGGADFILAFEELEALRALPYLKKGGSVIVNTQQILPLPVIIGAEKYPEGILTRLRGECETIALDALPLATKAGNARAVNTVLLGRLAKSLPHEKALWHRALEETLPPRFLEANLKAFEAGYAL
ncbi:MAG: indolepyruvate oxidoreductase subunit beta [Christensenellaceae bacterium]|jgi:indolepyruvate ferredoxin oxidoreductase beta subunit|nr:indolepyruvate oxidoreductase subunit beta [Christensenellaceae bacterium]